ncbi:hypothetical protein IQ269_16350 [Tychonema sp. LEGE 07199]|uniref:hypothetical protein n=1 Tax=unclassified Tychonema TaxID=2642144 RepID=UPI0018812AFC|nr:MULTISPECIES: hypothetical protein [unclassified Tychonema]MBE9122330.1 hypothetical protein [Tychonema sp. LEGE 07199]MBE9133556.1 hypothetical protein [Tychonema sp. LEGE 07196]
MVSILEVGRRKKEVRQRIRSTDVTDVTDVKDRRKKEEGRRKFGNGFAPRM